MKSNLKTLKRDSEYSLGVRGLGLEVPGFGMLRPEGLGFWHWRINVRDCLCSFGRRFFSSKYSMVGSF